MKKFILLLALLTFSFPAIAADQNVAYDRIEKSRKIRCGYGIWHPTIIKDPATGEMSGIIYEYVEALGTALGLEIEWTEEIGWGEFPTALKTGRIDVMCA
ncbi:MAG: transporter substrate-binding domain-containing protein, partial [Alphaproteobacteria bacterium]|nr:transporter substrate-binding domain-containing protein [Alphaproteobacteria bacterium]